MRPDPDFLGPVWHAATTGRRRSNHEVDIRTKHTSKQLAEIGFLTVERQRFLRQSATMETSTCVLRHNVEDLID